MQLAIINDYVSSHCERFVAKKNNGQFEASTKYVVYDTLYNEWCAGSNKLSEAREWAEDYNIAEDQAVANRRAEMRLVWKRKLYTKR